MDTISTAPTGADFSTPASPQFVEQVAAALVANNIEAIVVDTPDQARERVLELVPEGAEVHTGKSRTLEDTGLYKAFEDGPYNWLRSVYMKMDRRTQGDEIRKLTSAPDYMLGSVQAVTVDGALFVASYSASQIGAYAGTSRRVILVVGSQKIVPDFETALRRIREHVQPYEDGRLREQLGVGTKLAKLLVIYGEARPGRITVVLVREPVGV